MLPFCVAASKLFVQCKKFVFVCLTDYLLMCFIYVSSYWVPGHTDVWRIYNYNVEIILSGNEVASVSGMDCLRAYTFFMLFA